MRYLRIAFRSSGVLSPYESLSCGSLWTCFTKDGNLKENYQHAAEQDTTVKLRKQQSSEIEDYPELQDELVRMMQELSKAGQGPLSSTKAQPISLGMIQSLHPELL